MKIIPTMPRGVRMLLIGSAEIVALLILHHCMIAYFAGDDVISTILAGGPDSALGITILMIGFLVVRIMVILLLPGLILMRLGLVLYESLRS